MKMTELTKEQLIEEAKLKIAITKCHPNSGMARVEGELFKIARASLEAEPIAWRYRYVKKGVMDSQGELWVGDWKYVPKKEDCNDRPNYEIQALFTAPPVPVTSEELVKAVHFYEQLKRENPPASVSGSSEPY